VPVPEVKEAETEAQETEVTTKFVIDSRYYSKGVGLILGGTIIRGNI